MAMASQSRQWPDLPCATRLVISVYSFGFDVSRRSDGTVNRCLIKFFDPKCPSSSKPINGVTSSDVTVDPSRNLWFRLYVPSAAAGSSSDDSKLPVLVHFHGGGFVFCGANSAPYHLLCRRFAHELPAVVVSINYRLAPEHRVPSQYDDGFDTLRFIDFNQHVLPPNADLSRCFISGDSAGGNLAHHVTLRAANHHFERLKVIGQIAMQPFFGGEERTESELRLTNAPLVNTERTDWMWRAFLPVGSNRDNEAANVFGPNSVDISDMKFPATILFMGGYDPLQDWQRRYREGLNKYGKEVYSIEYPNAFHSFYVFPNLPEASMLIREVRNFIQKQSASLR